METNCVHEIQQNGGRIADDVNNVDKALKPLVVFDVRREAIEKDVQQVDAEDDRQVEPHPVEIQRQGLPHVELVEKLDVEQIEHPTADADCQQGSQQPIDQQHVWLAQPFVEFLFRCLATHDLFLYRGKNKEKRRIFANYSII